ncbi:flavohemoglobin expression-modulating QEGLA motif protein, partial [Alphaproteobacteria bacterium]|nr:flavohemoglobin expression-modulating QEGLA motif protein [Alphaproteobacteria bacterium]
RASTLLFEAERPLRVLSKLAWGSSVKAEFFASGCSILPKVSYRQEKYDLSRAHLDTAAPLLVGENSVCQMLRDTAQSIELTVEMLEAIGTKDFGTYSSALYGKPSDLTDLTKTSVHDLALFLDQQLEGLHPHKQETELFDATTFAGLLAPKVKDFFGDVAPKIKIIDNLSAKALAGRRFIKINKSSKFSFKDVSQLFHHEAVIHVGTTLNGLRQFDLPSISVPHAGTTKTQEGLAVFAEFMSGAMDPRRMRRLSDRVIAIEMAMSGANFLDIYRFFLERTDDPDLSFENSRRVMRGGLMSGGAPFTKDIVYLEGLLHLHQFLKQLLSLGRADLIPLLFCGKIDIRHLPALAILAKEKLIEPPIYLPPWAKDTDFLISFLAYSSFLNQPFADKDDQTLITGLDSAPVLKSFSA